MDVPRTVTTDQVVRDVTPGFGPVPKAGMVAALDARGKVRMVIEREGLTTLVNNMYHHGWIYLAEVV